MKSQTRNSKQIKMIKKKKIRNETVWDFWIQFVSDFDIRISNLFLLEIGVTIPPNVLARADQVIR